MTIFQSAANISKTQISSQAEELSSRVQEWMGPVHRYATWQSNSTWQELDNDNSTLTRTFFCFKSTFDPRKWCQGGGGGEKGGASPPPREEKLRDFTQNQLSQSQLGQRQFSQSQLGQRQVSPVNVMRTVQRQNKSQVNLNFQTYKTKFHVYLYWISWQNVKLTYKESLKMYFFVFLCDL